MLEGVKKDRFTQIAVLTFALLTAWWVILFTSGSKAGTSNLLFGAVYGPFMSLYGGVLGLLAARMWGGWKSLFGKAITILSIGLLAEFLGQTVFSFYNIVLHVEIPYPSLADLGFFGNIPFYLLGIFLLAHVSGAKFDFRTFISQPIAIIIPGAMLSFSYYLFLKSYRVDWSSPLTLFLDFAYPLGQALYVSFAIVTYGLSRKILGGEMRNKILLLIAAFVAQFLADFNFLFQNANKTWYNGGYGDYLYLVAYFLMTIGLLQLRLAAKALKT
jgi:hypothetical protein